jgi:hypothetical protein
LAFIFSGRKGSQQKTTRSLGKYQNAKILQHKIFVGYQDDKLPLSRQV